MVTNMKLNGKKITALFYDFDGVMTNNKVIVREDGLESVIVNRSDGYAVSQMRAMGLHQVIVSTEANPVVVHRAQKLKIPVISNVENKGEEIKQYCVNHNIDIAETAFVGNDLNDISAFETVSVRICPKDAAKEILDLADIVISVNGGDGVIRELYRLIVQ